MPGWTGLHNKINVEKEEAARVPSEPSNWALEVGNISNFFPAYTGDPHRDLVGQMKLFWVCSLRNSQRAVSSSGDREYILVCEMVWPLVMTCASESGSGTRRHPTGADRVSSAHQRASRAQLASSTTVMAHH